MTCMKKLTALLVSAALALSLLAGCGGGSKTLSQILLDLLKGQYDNVSVELDPDLEATLRQAISENDTEADVRAALEKLLGVTVTFSRLGDGQQGQHGFDLIFYPGSDPDAAARSAFTEWNKVFSSLPDDGQYSVGLSMVETDDGYYILAQVTVQKAGTQDKDEPAILQSIAITTLPTKTQYNTGESFDSAGMMITATYSDGHVKDVTLTECTLWIGSTEITSSYTFATAGTYTLTVEYQGVKSAPAISLQVKDKDGYHEENGVYVVTASDGLQKLFNDESKTFDGNTVIELKTDTTYTVDAGAEHLADTFKGTLKSADENTKASITLSGSAGLFGTLEDGHVENLSVTVTNKISIGTSYNAYHTCVGAMADVNSGGTISGCEVTINNGISSSNEAGKNALVGGVVGYNTDGNITGCSSTGTVTGDYAGGVVGYNSATVTACYSAGTVTGKGLGNAGGVVGYNASGTVTACYATGNVTATGSDGRAGGVVGVNESGSITACYATGNVTGDDAGGVMGWNNGTVTACYWSGSQTQGIGENKNDSDTKKVTSDGDTDKDDNTVSWDTAKNNLNSQSTGYTFGGDMNNPTLTKK